MLNQNDQLSPAFHYKRVGRLSLMAFTLLMAAVNVAAQTNQLQCRVQGTVFDELGAAITNARVDLKTGPHQKDETFTNPQGEFSIDCGTARAGRLIIRAPGFSVVDESWQRTTDSGTPLKMVLHPLPIKGAVTITAARTEMPLKDSPASAVVLSSSELSQSASIALDDALRQIPGFQLFRRSGSRAANPTSQGVSLRGVGASGASRALVLADGVPLNDPFGGWVYWDRVPVTEIEQVEVVRGASSNLYGSSALGGVVQVVTPSTLARSLRAEASLGNEQTRDASMYLAGAKSNWGATLGAATLHTDGYVLVDKPQRGRVDTAAGSRYSNGDLKIQRTFSDAGYLFVRGSLFGESRTNGTPLQINRTHIRQLNAAGEWRSPAAGNWSAKAYAATEVFDQTFSAVSVERNTESLTRLQRVPVQVVGITGQWTRTKKIFSRGSNELMAGFDVRSVRGVSDEIGFAEGRASSLSRAGGRELSSGIFVQDVLQITSQLILTGGARFDRWTNYRASSTTRSIAGNAIPLVNQFPNREEEAVSPKVAALYRVSHKVSLTGSVYRAFRQPTLNELYRSFRVGDVLTLANERLRAERLSGAEGGFRLSLDPGTVEIQGTFFYAEINQPVANATLSITPTLITRQRQNLGKTRARGLELEAEARPGRQWLVSGGYLFSDSAVVAFPTNPALEGLLVPQVPRHQFTFQIGYHNPKVIAFGMQARGATNQFDDDQNRFRLGSYFILDARVTRRITRNLDVFVAVENLLNRRYLVGKTPIATLGAPALARVGIKFNLGAK